MEDTLKPLRLTSAQKEFLSSKHIDSLDTLLHTYPLRYIPIVEPAKWEIGQEVLFQGLIVKDALSHPSNKGRILSRFSVLCWNQTIDVSLFSYGHYPALPAGKTITICGIYQGGTRVTARWSSFAPLPTGSPLYPVYSLPAKTRRDTMHKIMAKALAHADKLPRVIPDSLREKYRLMDERDALQAVHKPKNEAELAYGVRTLKYQEFLTFHTARLLSSAKGSKTPRQFDQKQIEEAIAALPYPLTPDQQSAVDDILRDLRQETIMYRLVQGDVGCGKTAVAAMAMKAMEASGHQSALLAPTELLARQHAQSLQKLGLNARLYCASLKANEKREVLAGLKDGSISIVTGTHSLFQPDVEFASLGLVVADEQQRFGVLQRRALIEKGKDADVLLMSATPIPRTAAHFLYGDIDLSSIRTMPPNRHPVKTQVFASASMKPVLPRILEGIEQEGRQVYVVCPAVEENEEDNFHAARQIYQGMEQVLGRRVKIGLLHGKMKTADKQKVMEDFAQGRLQVLVATTVIEVGIDVPNATMMVIYDAHRFGLSALHQLRGRCARGTTAGECYLLSASKDPQARARLKIMEEVDNGFDLSRYDLALRGPGDLLGTRQSGLPAFILGDAGKDLKMMECCAQDAADILAHPEREENRALLKTVNHALSNARFLD